MRKDFGGQEFKGGGALRREKNDLDSGGCGEERNSDQI